MEIPTPNKIDKVPETSKKPKLPEDRYCVLELIVCTNDRVLLTSIFPDVGEYMFTPSESSHSSKKDRSMQYFDSKSNDVEVNEWTDSFFKWMHISLIRLIKIFIKLLQNLSKLSARNTLIL